MEKLNVSKAVAVSLLVLSVIATLLGGACAKPTPAPAATTKPAPAASPKPASAPAPAATKPIQRIDISSGPTGTRGNVMSHALADLINKNSSWLRASVIEEVSAATSLVKLNTLPETRRNTIVTAVTVALWESKMGNSPYKNPWMPRVIAGMSNGGYVWTTLNSKIKKASDLSGKTVSMGPTKTGSVSLLSEAMLEIGGVSDKVKRVYITYAEQGPAMKTGSLDVATWTSDMLNPKKWQGMGALAEFMITYKEHYFMNPGDLKELQAYADKSGKPVWGVVVPAGSGLASYDFNAFGYGMGWAAAPEMDEATAYEVTRIMWENAGKFVEYHAQGASITREGLPMMPYPEKDWHPGALKLYKEKGVKVGA